MTDPFQALRMPVEPTTPDPRFAEELRDQLRRTVLNGADMSTTQAPARADYHSLSPYLAVRDGRRAIEFYIDAFGATQRAEPIVMDDGRIGHAELAIGDSVLMLAEEFSEIGHTAPPSGGAAIRIEVSNVDAAVERAIELGAELVSEVRDEPHGRQGNITDPFGQRWLLAQAPGRSVDDVPVRHGQGGYFTFTVPDDEAAKAFYGAVLGWQFSPGHAPRSWGAEGPGLVGSGIAGGQSYAGWKVMYAVDDITAALGRVRDAGGQAGEPDTQPYGVTADCVDNQGVEFWLWEIPAGQE